VVKRWRLLLASVSQESIALRSRDDGPRNHSTPRFATRLIAVNICARSTKVKTAPRRTILYLGTTYVADSYRL
jgi:hypothetical protein